MHEIDISILDRCTARQLNDLLELASTETQSKFGLLLEIGDSEQMEYLLVEIGGGDWPAECSIVNQVCSPDTPLESLIVIKSTAKRLAVAAESSIHKAAATLLYHLSVASAIGHHGRNISSKDPSEWLPLYSELARELLDSRLTAIFKKALARITCRS